MKVSQEDIIKRQTRLKVAKLLLGIFCAVIIVIFFAGNGFSPYRGEGQDKSIAAGDSIAVEQDKDAEQGNFPFTDLPMYLQSSKEGAAEWLAEHYFDNYIAAIRSNADYRIQEDVLKRATSQYIQIISTVPYDQACKGIKRAMSMVDESKPHLTQMMKVFEDLLYFPNSPLLNEELYIPVLESIIASKTLSNDDKTAYREHYKIVCTNRVGTVALDFKYIYLTGGGAKRLTTLHKTAAKLLIVYFNNPGCTSCKEIKATLSQNPQLRRMIDEKSLIVLSIYPDEDLEQWEADFKDFPSEWIYAADPTAEIKDNDKWGIRAIPSLYLLDENKKVLLKDATIEKIMDFLFSYRAN